MAVIKNGLLLDAKITQNIISNIERPGLDFTKINAIIIHQTDSYNASGTMNYWKTSKIKAGAHFVIDRNGGSFSETTENPKNPGTGIFTGKTRSYTGTDGKIYQTAHLNKRCNHAGRLRDKKYPNNYNSIGIEFVGKYDWVKNTYPPPSIGQIQSGAWLVKTLIELISTIPSFEAVYAHGVIAYKTPDMTEGGTTLGEIKEELSPKKKELQEIKIESPCTEILQLLFPYICGQEPNVLTPNKKP